MSQKPDIFLGLICAAGTDLTEVKQQLRAQLAVVGYSVEEIKVSSAIAEALSLAEESDEYERTKGLMDAGDLIRASSDNGSGVASLIVTAIRSRKGDSEKPSSTAYLIDSLKNPKELEVLDQLYGRNFYSISVFSTEFERREILANKIARSRKRPLEEKHSELADQLIRRDQKGRKSTGQSVSDTFHRADFFTDSVDVADPINRFVRLIFGDPFITPTRDEFLMFVAKANALRSCDLSRQVGAVIADRSGSVVATGCNEVPYPGGGFFVEGDDASIGDNRDKEERHDPNFNEVKRSISELVGIIQGAGYLNADHDPDKLADELLHGEHREEMKDARLRNLIEFSRVVHAEMQALSQAARNGRPVEGASLYCTTYPCHLCSRHIISSGIREVVYIEPYPKSLTATLYHREIRTDESESGLGAGDARVLFRPFKGISPILYQRVFAYRKRKDEYGAIAKWLPDVSVPVGATARAADPEFELFTAKHIATVIEKIHSTENGNHHNNGQGEGGDAGVGAAVTDSTGQGSSKQDER